MTPPVGLIHSELTAGLLTLLHNRNQSVQRHARIKSVNSSQSAEDAKMWQTVQSSRFLPNPLFVQSSWALSRLYLFCFFCLPEKKTDKRSQVFAPDCVDGVTIQSTHQCHGKHALSQVLKKRQYYLKDVDVKCNVGFLFYFIILCLFVLKGFFFVCLFWGSLSVCLDVLSVWTETLTCFTWTFLSICA